MGIVTSRPFASVVRLPAKKGAAVIQQVITCDVCGSQKRQTNHWFVAREESGELRISGWNSVYLLSPATKHLCGETCAHKLISQFLMTCVNVGTQLPADKSDRTPSAGTRITARTDCAGPSLSQWDASPSTTSSPRPWQYVPRESERLHRPQSCTGRKRS